MDQGERTNSEAGRLEVIDERGRIKVSAIVKAFLECKKLPSIYSWASDRRDCLCGVAVLLDRETLHVVLRCATQGLTLHAHEAAAKTLGVSVEYLQGFTTGWDCTATGFHIHSRPRKNWEWFTGHLDGKTAYLTVKTALK